MTWLKTMASIRSQAVAGIEAAGGNSTDATAFVGSIGSGTLLQMLIAFFQNPADVAALEQFIQFIVSLFAAGGGTLTPKA